jgi:tetratricopeptide (TPR) repeat protein
MHKAYWCAVFLALFSTVPVSSQVGAPVSPPVDTGAPVSPQVDAGRDTVVLYGIVRGIPPNTTCMAEISGLKTAMTRQIAICGSDGSFEFKDLERGTYTLLMHLGTDEFSQTVFLVSSREEIEVQVPQRASTGPSRGPEQTVSASELRIPDKAKRELEIAEQLLQQGKLSKADQHLVEALQIAPRFARAMTMRAVVMLANRDLNSALQTVDAAISLDPTLAMTQFVRASVLNQMGYPREAELAAEQGLRLSPSWQGHFELAKAMSTQRRFHEALAELNIAGSAAPKDTSEIFLVRAAVLLQLQDFAGAQTNLNEFTKLSPGDARARDLQTWLDQHAPAR